MLRPKSGDIPRTPISPDKDHEQAEISNFYQSQQREHVVLPMIQLQMTEM